MRNTIGLILITLFFVSDIFAIPVKNKSPLIRKTMTHNGLQRSYYLYVPSKINQAKIPLLIALHGGMGNGEKMEKLTQSGFNTLADEENFIVVYPNGIGRNWNDGRKSMPSNYKAHNNTIDDVGFISALIKKLIETDNVDPARVYVTGMSNGAMMTHRLAIELSDQIAAGAAVCGNIPADLTSTPKSKVSMMMINSMNDPLVPYEGGYVHFRKKQLGRILSAKESLNFWLEHNGIVVEPTNKEFPSTQPDDGCRAISVSYLDNDQSTEVVLISIEGGGHTWPGGWQYFGEKLIGKTCRDFDACQMIWDFCKKHSK
ncbi:MAG: phospholipase [Bacteroidetes bacterium HGW-Bacteroidetes-21]|nr:MAG: phospholipase [Bacteroidetes bacterium HGW-Bacteroidetes-21]